MNELIRITEKVSFGETIQTVNARDLHGFLGSQREFATWIRERIESFGFEEDTDFLTILSESTGGRPCREYHLSLDMAKELAMVERNDKGKQARQYFIECEKKFKELLLPKPQTEEMILANAVLVAQKVIEAKNQQIALMQPKAAIYDRCMASDDALDMGVVAKMFGIGRNVLFQTLRLMKVLMENNVPYQEYAHHFKVIEKPWEDRSGAVHMAITTKVRQSGLRFLSKKIGLKLVESAA